MTHQPSTDELVRRNARYADDTHVAGRAPAPERHLAVVACMDARIDVLAALGLHVGDAHVIRNAGGIVTDDVIRSLTISQRVLATREIVLLHHTDCGLQAIREEQFVADLVAEVGAIPPWSVGAFADATEDVRESMRRIAGSPFVTHTEHLRGFVFDVASGLLQEVEPAGHPAG